MCNGAGGGPGWDWGALSCTAMGGFSTLLGVLALKVEGYAEVGRVQKLGSRLQVLACAEE